MEGGWIDAKGNFLAGVARRAGVQAARQEGPRHQPSSRKQETALIDGDIAFRQHAGGHTTGPNWPTFLKFAERYFEGK